MNVIFFQVGCQVPIRKPPLQAPTLVGLTFVYWFDWWRIESQPDGAVHDLFGGRNRIGAVEVVNLHGFRFALHNDRTTIFEAELLVVIGVVLQ